jgi:hypothetical protein
VVQAADMILVPMLLALTEQSQLPPVYRSLCNPAMLSEPS